MHLLTLPARLEIGPKDILEPGEYLTPDIVAAQLLLMADGGTMRPLTEERRLFVREGGDEGGFPTGERVTDGNVIAGFEVRSIMIQRAGGFGDLVLLTPVLREIKRKWPNCRLAVSTMAHYGAVLHGLPYIDEILPFPLPRAIADSFDAWIFYENAIEKNPRAHELHMTELFGEIAGITSIADLKPEYRIKPVEAIWANEAYPRVNGTRRVAVQVGASARSRRYPMFGETCSEMVRRGWEVMLLGTPGELPPMPKEMNPLIRDLTRLGLTFRQSCAVLNLSDCFVGSDTALLHVAGALAVPAVGLYASFPWRLRTKYCPTTVALSGVGECAPCFHHVGATMRNHYPEQCPTANKDVCGVLASIKPERIVAKLDQIARRIEPMGEAIPFKQE